MPWKHFLGHLSCPPKGYLSFLLYIELIILHKNSMLGENIQHRYARNVLYLMALSSTCYGDAQSFMAIGKKYL